MEGAVYLGLAPEVGGQPAGKGGGKGRIEAARLSDEVPEVGPDSHVGYIAGDRPVSARVLEGIEDGELGLRSFTDDLSYLVKGLGAWSGFG